VAVAGITDRYRGIRGAEASRSLLRKPRTTAIHAHASIALTTRLKICPARPSRVSSSRDKARKKTTTRARGDRAARAPPGRSNSGAAREGTPRTMQSGSRRSRPSFTHARRRRSVCRATSMIWAVVAPTMSAEVTNPAAADGHDVATSLSDEPASRKSPFTTRATTRPSMRTVA
jgi:hypothetical protein